MDKEIGLEEQKQIQIKGLLYLKKVCEEHNITYFLASGTLLGAIKYKGYIPWDDDIDICLKRNDYAKLLKVMAKEKNDEYKVLTPYNTKDYYYPYAKLVCTKTKIIENARDIKENGVYIDIFPLDYFNDIKKFQKIKHIRNLCTRRMQIKNNIVKSNLKEYKTEKSILKGIKNHLYSFISFITLPLGYNFYAKFLDKLSSRSKREKYIGIIYMDPYDCFEATLFDEIDEYTFEGYKFTSIKNYDIYLTNLYGDYKKELPANKQCSHHQIKAYWR